MAGRPPNKILISNFQRLAKKDNQSNRYIWECNHCPSGATGACIEGRDNRPFLHLIDPIACPNAPSDVRHEARLLLMEKGLLQTDAGPILTPLPSSHDSESKLSLSPASDAGCVIPIKKRKGGKLDQYIIPALTREQEAEANVKFFRCVCCFGHCKKLLINLCRFLVHTNSAFRSAENPFLYEWLDVIRPSYIPASRYVLSHTIMDAEAARVQVEEIARLHSRNLLTMLFDGWEDKLRRSLYGTIASEVGQHPTVLSLEELTGFRGSADKYLETAINAMTKMDLGDGVRFIAATTDDPNVMRAFRRKLEGKYYWILVSAHLCPSVQVLNLKNNYLDVRVLFAWS